MARDRAWTIKGVSDRTRNAALEVAHAADLTVGEWIDQVLARAVAEARHPRPPAATREDVTALLDARLGPLEEALRRIAERFTALEEKLEQRTGPNSARTGPRGSTRGGRGCGSPRRERADCRKRMVARSEVAESDVHGRASAR